MSPKTFTLLATSSLLSWKESCGCGSLSRGGDVRESHSSSWSLSILGQRQGPNSTSSTSSTKRVEIGVMTKIDDP